MKLITKLLIAFVVIQGIVGKSYVEPTSNTNRFRIPEAPTVAYTAVYGTDARQYTPQRSLYEDLEDQDIVNYEYDDPSEYDEDEDEDAANEDNEEEGPNEEPRNWWHQSELPLTPSPSATGISRRYARVEATPSRSLQPNIHATGPSRSTNSRTFSSSRATSQPEWFNGAMFL